MLEDKYITLRYFDDEGKFCIFMIALPVFVIAMTAGLSLAIKMIISIIKGSHHSKKTLPATEEKTEEDKVNKDDKK